MPSVLYSMSSCKNLLFNSSLAGHFAISSRSSAFVMCLGIPDAGIRHKRCDNGGSDLRDSTNETKSDFSNKCHEI